MKLDLIIVVTLVNAFIMFSCIFVSNASIILSLQASALLALPAFFLYELGLLIFRLVVSLLLIKFLKRRHEGKILYTACNNWRMFFGACIKIFLKVNLRPNSVWHSAEPTRRLICVLTNSRSENLVKIKILRIIHMIYSYISYIIWK